MNIIPLPSRIKKLYQALLDHFGFHNWWPGETALEIVCGALLTQNTNWNNVEKALNNIKAKNLLELDKLLDLPMEQLETLIKPTGYYRQKAVRLKNLLLFLKNGCGWNGFSEIQKDPALFRRELLLLNGIGPETADSILCYGFDYKFFVVDAYTKRILSRLGGFDSFTEYEEIRALFETEIKDQFSDELSIYKDLHAQIVMLAKCFCKKKPDCAACPLKEKGLCVTGCSVQTQTAS